MPQALRKGSRLVNKGIPCFSRMSTGGKRPTRRSSLHTLERSAVDSNGRVSGEEPAGEAESGRCGERAEAALVQGNPADSDDGSGSEMERWVLYNEPRHSMLAVDSVEDEQQEHKAFDGGVDPVASDTRERQIEAMAFCFMTSARFLKHKYRGTRNGQIARGLWETLSLRYAPNKPIKTWKSLFKKYESSVRGRAKDLVRNQQG
ncbi:hypothetical protein CALCODRAFT_512065 [Calocera cornea HHB12733]|uniref:Uncharacterized protein n=1 Tax=Calocera cornea HHB12733 TaxID=1353952 RepID=A0A165DB63_9BASI|nr:hypothetical protein CALCODRAFT_512065 [Calocera cornea HHB12733]